MKIETRKIKKQGFSEIKIPKGHCGKTFWAKLPSRRTRDRMLKNERPPGYFYGDIMSFRIENGWRSPQWGRDDLWFIEIKKSFLKGKDYTVISTFAPCPHCNHLIEFGLYKRIKPFEAGLKLCKTHQNVLVFCKGDENRDNWRKAAAFCRS